MASMAVALVKGLNNAECIVVLDAYFAVGPVFLILKGLLNSNGERLVHLITHAKRNVVGHEDPPPRTGKPGAPRKYGEKLKLIELFEDKQNEFQEAVIEIYKQRRRYFFFVLISSGSQ